MCRRPVTAPVCGGRCQLLEQCVVDFEAVLSCESAQAPVVALGDVTARLPGGDGRTSNTKERGKCRGTPPTSSLTEANNEMVQVRVHGTKIDAYCALCQGAWRGVTLRAIPAHDLDMIGRPRKSQTTITPVLLAEAALAIDAVHERHTTGLRDRLRALRYLDGQTLRQEDASEEIGASRSAWAGYEQGRRDMGPEVLCRIAARFRITVDFILGRGSQGMSGVQRSALIEAMARAWAQERD